MTELPRFSVIAPMLNEADNAASLADEIAAACAPLGPFEAIFVDDGSTDETPARLAELKRRHPWLRVLRHHRPCGQSAALRTGALAARAPVVCTLDGDGQNPPAEIPKLVTPLLDHAEGRLGLVAGQRVQRQDTLSKRLASRAANAIRSALLRDGTRDTGCGLKAMPRDVFLSLPYFDHMHRYLPALVRREGYQVRLVDVAHRARPAGTSKYNNLSRGAVGAVDLLGVWWLTRRRRLPETVHEDV